MLTKEEKQTRLEARRQARREAKAAALIESHRNQKPIKVMTISIEWKKSRMWGMNPHATVQVEYHDSSYGGHGFRATCSGCGYCKESTVIADCFNEFLRYKLFNPALRGKESPYGINFRRQDPSYSGGIGTECYSRIAEYLGGTFERVASGKTFDVYRYTDNQEGVNQ